MSMLDTFLHERRGRVFAWGSHDCCTFAADWVLAATGRDPMADLRGLDSPLQAMRRLRDLGGFVEAGVKAMGPALPGLMAQRGDVVLVRSGRRFGRASGYAFAICTGGHLAAAGTDRLLFLAITDAEAAWRV
ncbi:hypothetical protein GT347_20350 [Xylophilus rhododendri]|uniref:DUF6950 domain-containing protein n=1 Tax=Xylophilus rhododendri TaxID=2697032 RepID=A0A857JA83_9BURK|nr:hypothetical protein [Xylophilus rhododendri]QHJ00124.1 hypothetical protein GT347_20350 [Xylophilus rhododendri]